MTLGQALAYLHYNKASNNTFKSLNKDDIEFLNSIKSRIENLRSDSHHVFTHIKNSSYNDYTDLFIYIFLNDNFADRDLDLLQFFNNNIECFEAYAIVLNDFLQKMEDLKIN